MAEYCFMFGNYTIPDSYLTEDGYDCAPNQRQDLDSYTDADGVTHRNVVPHTKSDIVLSFRQLRWSEFNSLLSGMVSNYISSRDRDANCSYWDPESNTIKTGHFYLDPSCRFKIKKLNAVMSPFTLHFVEY